MDNEILSDRITEMPMACPRSLSASNGLEELLSEEGQG